jgi:DNA-binding YbaB/EbfC family protein
MNNLQQLMQMGQQLQARITKLQESLGAQKVTGSSGGGMVNATVDGKGEVKEIRIDPACVDKNDVEMLEDLVVAAVAQAQAKAKQMYEEEMKKAAGGLPMPIPGLL